MATRDYTTQDRLLIQVSRKDAQPGVQFTRVSIGQTVELSPHCDLWMQGARQAEIRVIRTYKDRIILRVRPIVAGQTLRTMRSILPHHVLA